MQNGCTHKVRFRVTLSNKETHTEGEGIFIEEEGELSPWQRLSKYVIDNKLYITALELVTPDDQVHRLPSPVTNPQLHNFNATQNPIDYDFGRLIARDMEVQREGTRVKPTGAVEVAEHFTIATAIYPTHKLQIWVNEIDTTKSYVLFVPVS